MLQIIGDSYVAALQVPWGTSCGGQVARRAREEYRVITTGVGNAGFPAYLRFAEWGRDRQRIARAVFVIVENDFFDSRWELTAERRAFVWQKNEQEELIRRPPTRGTRYTVQQMPSWFRKSDLVRYAGFNLGLIRNYQAMAHALGRMTGTGRPAGTNRTRGELAAIHRETAETFVDRIASATGLEPAEIALVLTEDRGQSAAREHLKQLGAERGMKLADLDPLLEDGERRRGQRFDLAPHDPHWRPWAHTICAQQILALDWFDRAREEVPDTGSTQGRERNAQPTRIDQGRPHGVSGATADPRPGKDQSRNPREPRLRDE